MAILPLINRIMRLFKALANTGATRGTSIEKRFEELGLESLQYRWWVVQKAMLLL